MASNYSRRQWNIRVTPLPQGLDRMSLAHELRLPTHRVSIPKSFNNNGSCAWIYDFKDEDDAREFERQWSGAWIRGQKIKCTVSSRLIQNDRKPNVERGSHDFRTTSSSSQYREAETNSLNSNLQESRQYSGRNRNALQDSTSNFKTNEDDECGETFSSRTSIRTRSDSSASSISSSDSLNSEQSSIRSSAPCLFGVSCHNVYCIYEHPDGWNPCVNGDTCDDYNCIATHSSKRKPYCPDGSCCTSIDCQSLHPKTRSQECWLGAKCLIWNCSKLHPMSRARLCQNKKDCTDLSCLYLHPPERTQVLCSLGADCRDLACLLNHPPERPSVCDQPDVCLNYYCTRLHRPDWSPGETETDDVKPSQRARRSGLKTQEQRTQERQKARLPILSCREEFCQRLQTEHLLIVTAETGSGKSTQLPQYAAEHFGSLIVCTQPRVVAALSLARRVAEEYDGKSVGESVGYKVGNENRVKGTDIMYMTDSAVIRESQRDPDLKHVRVLIIDEAHERSLNTDIVIGIAKILLEKRPDDFYVVIASATINPTAFLQFFNRQTSAILTVEGRVFPVSLTYKPPPTDDSSNQKMIEKHIVSSLIDSYPRHAGHTLVFLPGQNEIERVMKTFIVNLPNDCVALPLYGSQSPEEQERVIKFNEINKRMVVFCTNVAETSLTIPNVQLVIDSGWAKEARYDVKRRLTVLETVRVSRSSADQRKGRAGRTASGCCVRLYKADELTRENIEPEILRSSLDLILLQLIRLSIDPKTFPFIDQPSSDIIGHSMNLITHLKCVDEQKITKRGELFAELGLDPRFSAFIVEIYAEYRSLLELTVGIVTILSAPGNIFFMGGEKQDAKARISLQAHDHESDLLHLYTVYEQWKNAGGMEIRGKCSQCNKFLRYCICRIKHSNQHHLNNKILQHVDNSSASIIKQIKNALWLSSNDQIPQNKLDIIGRQLVQLFPEQHGYLLVPKLPVEGVRLASNNIRASITNTSTFMQKLRLNTDRELYQHFIAMNITQIPSGRYIIEKLHPVLKSDAPVQSEIQNLLTLENIGSELAYQLRQKLNSYRLESWAKWLVYHYDRIRCCFNIWGFEEDKSMIMSNVKQIYQEILIKIYETYEQFDYGPIRAQFQSGLVCKSIRQMTNTLRINVKTSCHTVSDLKGWVKRFIGIEWDEIEKYSFQNQSKVQNENNQYNTVCLFFKNESTFRQAMDKIPAHFMIEDENTGRRYHDIEKDSWGRELVVETPPHVTVDDIIKQYGNDVITRCIQLNKRKHDESFIKLNNLPNNTTEAVLRQHLRNHRGPTPKYISCGLTRNRVSGWATIKFDNDEQRDRAAMIYQMELCNNEFSINFLDKRGQLKQKFIRTIVMKNDDPSLRQGRPFSIPKNIFHITVISREAAREIFSPSTDTTFPYSYDRYQWIIDSSATLTIDRTDLFPDFQTIIDQTSQNFQVKATYKDLPNSRKRYTFSKGNPQQTSQAASLLAQTFAPITIHLHQDHEKQLFQELNEMGELEKWAKELSLAIDINKYHTKVEIRGPQTAQGQVMRRIADYSDRFDERFRTIELNATVATFFGPQKSASSKLEELTLRWSSKNCSIFFNSKTATITMMGKPNVSSIDFSNCQKEVLQFLNEITANIDQRQTDDDDDDDSIDFETKRFERQCVFCHQQSNVSTSSFRICGHAFCRCAAKTLATSATFPLRCKACQSHIHIRDIQIIFNTNEQLLLSLLKTSIQQYFTANPRDDDRVFCPNHQCNGLVRLSKDYQTCLTCGQNVCPRCQVVDDEVHFGLTCSKTVEEKKRHPFLSKLFGAAKLFVQDHWPFDSKLRPISSIDENPYLRKEYQSLKRFYEGNDVVGHSTPPDLATGFFAYHGTSVDAIDNICQTGFDPKHRSGQAYGRGEYFGVTASISHGYCHKDGNSAGFSRMIIAFILRCPQVTTKENFCYVVDNPADWTYAFNLPVLVVTYGPDAFRQPSPFPLSISSYPDNNVRKDVPKVAPSSPIPPTLISPVPVQRPSKPSVSTKSDSPGCALL